MGTSAPAVAEGRKGENGEEKKGEIEEREKSIGGAKHKRVWRKKEGEGGI